MARLSPVAALLATAMVCVSCGGSKIEPVEWPTAAPLAADVQTFSSALAQDEQAAEQMSVDTELPSGTISLEQALAAALLFNPELQAFAWEVRAREAGALQAGKHPNPEFEVEVEEFAGTGELSGFGGSVANFIVAQGFPLGGGPKKERDAARIEAKLGGWDYEEKRLEVATRTVTAYLDVIAAKQMLKLAEESLALTQKLHDTVRMRLEAGKVPPAELQRTEVMVTQEKMANRNAERELRLAYLHLAAVWGSDKVAFDVADQMVAPSFEVPSLASLSSIYLKSPALLRFEDELRLAEQTVVVEASKAIPDLNLGVGVQHFAESSDVSLIASVGIDIPLFDRNQGGVAQARYLVLKTKAEHRAAVSEYLSTLQEAYLALEGAREASKTIDQEVLPLANAAYQAVNQAYSMGKIGLLDLIDAQQTFLEVRAEQVSTRADFYRALAEVEGLIGSPISREGKAATKKTN